MFDIIMCSVRLIQVSIFHRTDLPLSAPNVHEPGHVLDWSIATANSGTSREEIRGIQAGESCTAKIIKEKSYKPNTYTWS